MGFVSASCTTPYEPEIDNQPSVCHQDKHTQGSRMGFAKPSMPRNDLCVGAGSSDVFADTSAAVGDAFSPNFVPAAMLYGAHESATTGTFEGIQELSISLGLTGKNRRRILANPPAGTVREREYRHAPWMNRFNRRIESENQKAEAVIFEKRIFDMAKQAVAGLQDDQIDTNMIPGVGVRCEMTTVANIVRTAFKYRDLGPDQRRAVLYKRKTEAEHACRVLDACLRFDCRRLAALLGLVVKREKTFGIGVPI